MNRPVSFASSRLFRIACVAAIAVVVSGVSLLVFLRSEPGNIDDGFIVMVYVRHLIHDGAIAWNVEDGPVDGCTSMLDLLVKSAVVMVTKGDIVWCTFLVTAILHVFVPLLSIAIVLRLPAGSANIRLVAAAAVGLMLASMKASAYGASFLLETPLYLFCAFILFGLVILTDRYSALRLGSLILAGWMVALARPEGLALAIFGIGAALKMEQEKEPLHRLLAVFGLFVLGVAIYEIWHVRYFGAWAPNAYYAKTSALRKNEILDGVRYVLAFLSTTAGWVQLGPVLMTPFAALGSAWSSPRARFNFAVVSLAALGGVVITIYAGGDSYPNGRFFSLSIALGFFAVGLGIVYARDSLRKVFLVGASSVVLFQCAGLITASPGRFGTHVRYATSPKGRRCEERVAFALRNVIPSGTIAQTDFQRLKYWCDPLRVLDLEGLSNRQIAHEPVYEPVKLGKFRPVTVLRTQPEVWIPGYKFRTQISRVFTKPHPLLSDPVTQMQRLGYDERREVAEGAVAVELANLYVPASLESCGVFFNFFVRKDLARKFSEAGFLIEGF